jgi:hypothetical protein
LREYLGSLALLLSFNTAQAVVCPEIITSVINHSDGAVYFTTNGTCAAGWCQLNGTGGASFQNQGYAMLLTAQSLGKVINFSWPNLQSCATPNPLYASPDYMFITP